MRTGGQPRVPPAGSIPPRRQHRRPRRHRAVKLRGRDCQVAAAAGSQRRPTVRGQREGNGRVAQRVAPDQAGDGRIFGRRRHQGGQARRQVSKQVPRCDGGARRPRGRTVPAQAVLRYDDLGSPPGRRGADDGQVGGDRHARQRLTPEAQRPHRQQIIGGANLGSAVPLDGQPQVAAGDPAPVVGNRDARAPAALHLDGDTAGAGIERVIQQLAHDGQRTLDHFTGGNTRGDGRWQRLYP